MLKQAILMAALCLVGPLAVADDIANRIGKAVTGLTGLPVQGVTKMPGSELYEVRANGNFFYTDKDASVIVNGQAYDARSKENLTQKTIAEQQKFSWSEIPLRLAIKVVVGQGARQMVVFEDPNCGYCKKLETELQKLSNVTIHVMPLAILSPDSETKLVNVLCARDKARTWVSSLQTGAAAATCTDPKRIESAKKQIEEVRQLAQKLQVTGTPTILYRSGKRTNGFEPAEAIEAKLAEK